MGPHWSINTTLTNKPCSTQRAAQQLSTKTVCQILRIPGSDKTRWTRHPYADKADLLATVGALVPVWLSGFIGIYHFIDESRNCHFKDSLLMGELISNENTFTDRNALVPEGQRNMRLKSYVSHQI